MDLGGFLGSLIINFVKGVYFFFKYVSPWLWKVMVAVLSLMTATLLSICNGLKPEIDNIADKIMFDAGPYVPIDLQGVLSNLSYVVAFITVLLGYVLLCYVTVGLCNWAISYL